MADVLLYFLVRRFHWFPFFSGGCLHETAQSRCDEKRSGLPACCVGAFFFVFPVVVVCMRLLNPDVMKREVACPPVRHARIQQQSPNTGISRVTVYCQGRYRRKTKYPLPSRNYRRDALPPKYYRHILVLLFPSRQLPSDIEIPSTVEKLPSCPITTDIITGTYWFYRFRQGSYRQITKYGLPSAKLPASGNTAPSETA